MSPSYLSYQEAVKAGPVDEAEWCPSLKEKAKHANTLSKAVQRQIDLGEEEGKDKAALDLGGRAWKGKRNKPFVRSGNAKLTLECTDCLKRRAVYVDPAAVTEEVAAALLERVRDAGAFVCGQRDLLVLEHKRVAYAAAPGTEGNGVEESKGGEQQQVDEVDVDLVSTGAGGGSGHQAEDGLLLAHGEGLLLPQPWRRLFAHHLLLLRGGGAAAAR
jgi:hypothetical protein